VNWSTNDVYDARLTLQDVGVLGYANVASRDGAEESIVHKLRRVLSRRREREQRP
jgi:hypothetical protein